MLSFFRRPTRLRESWIDKWREGERRLRLGSRGPDVTGSRESRMWKPQGMMWSRQFPILAAPPSACPILDLKVPSVVPFQGNPAKVIGITKGSGPAQRLVPEVLDLKILEKRRLRPRMVKPLDINPTDRYIYI